MMTDEDESVREKAVTAVLEVRERERLGEGQEEMEYEESVEVRGEEDEEEDLFPDQDIDLGMDEHEREALKNNKIRKYKLPLLNFNPKNYYDLFSWEKPKLHEPSLTKHLTDDEVRNIIQSPLYVCPFPCHTQAVERAIQLITEAATSVIGEGSRDGWIRQTIKSRREMGRFDTKKDFYQKIKKSTE